MDGLLGKAGPRPSRDGSSRTRWIKSIDVTGTRVRRLDAMRTGGQRGRDPRLHPWLMPYDDRLDGCDSPLPGTRSDFASRAAHHFVEAVVLDTPKASARSEEHTSELQSLMRISYAV